MENGTMENEKWNQIILNRRHDVISLKIDAFTGKMLTSASLCVIWH